MLLGGFEWSLFTIVSFLLASNGELFCGLSSCSDAVSHRRSAIESWLRVLDL
ncbi:hypothetical protein SynMVIR181_00910 [Synechococcus sp. MVIR-18-1]|nr:hypothetical protein SynMVIR181_00910 [Synechococcus sp. MVIR-18-1]